VTCAAYIVAYVLNPSWLYTKIQRIIIRKRKRTKFSNVGNQLFEGEQKAIVLMKKMCRSLEQQRMKDLHTPPDQNNGSGRVESKAKSL
jgi:hypothetical protein